MLSLFDEVHKYISLALATSLMVSVVARIILDLPSPAILCFAFSENIVTGFGI